MSDADRVLHINLKGNPSIILIAGLQGSGKTTTAGKLAKRLQKEGYVQEFFLEGTRSRTGKLMHPKLGMLSMELDIFAEGVAKAGAVSLGVVDNQVVIDLDYAEDSRAGTDMNVVMNNAGQFIEVTSTSAATAAIGNYVVFRNVTADSVTLSSNCRVNSAADGAAKGEPRPTKSARAWSSTIRWSSTM